MKEELKVHQGKPHSRYLRNQQDVDIKEDSLLGNCKQNGIRCLVGVTLYNEPVEQVLESALGVYRNYLELLDVDRSYENKMAFCIIADGLDVLMQDPSIFLKPM